MWNSLPQEAAVARTLNIFRKQLDIALEMKGIKGIWGKGVQAIELDDQP